MFAEIHKKTPKSERWEDVLTSSFFGPLSYTSSFEAVLKNILLSVKFREEKQNTAFKEALEEIQNDWKIHFWKKLDRKEIDLLIISNKSKTIIGIEVKYENELSGEEQLSNYAHLLEKKYRNYNRFLLFLAKDTSAKLLYDKTYKDVIKSDKKIQGFGYTSWQSFYRVLEQLKTNIHPDKIIISDLLKYLKFKNLNGFLNFNIEELNSRKVYPNHIYNFN